MFKDRGGRLNQYLIDACNTVKMRLKTYRRNYLRVKPNQLNSSYDAFGLYTFG